MTLEKFLTCRTGRASAPPARQADAVRRYMLITDDVPSDHLTSGTK
jgi:hypothetical protein